MINSVTRVAYRCAVARGHESERGIGLLELTAILAISGIAAAALLGGVYRVSHGARRLEAVAIARDALGYARRTAYLGAATVALTTHERGFSILSGDSPNASATFDLPRSFVVESSSRTGTVRFYPDGLSDNASITLKDVESGELATLFVDSRGEIR